MGKMAAGICTMAALALSSSSIAQVATTAAFDGFYRGVSRQVEAGPMGRGNTGRCPIPDGVPAPLRVVGGIARAGSAETPMEGSVTADGVLVMRTQNGGKLEGQIDPQGRASGRFTVSCSYQYVWQRR